MATQRKEVIAKNWWRNLPSDKIALLLQEYKIFKTPSTEQITEMWENEHPYYKYKEKLSAHDFINNDSVETQDEGRAKIYTVNVDNDANFGLFFQFHSWDEEGNHEEFNKFIGRKIRITIETID